MSSRSQDSKHRYQPSLVRFPVCYFVTSLAMNGRIVTRLLLTVFCLNIFLYDPITLPVSAL